MKKYFALLSLLTTFAAYACPTCIGRMTKKSPPFFSNQSYQPNKNNKQSQRAHKSNLTKRSSNSTTKATDKEAA